MRKAASSKTKPATPIAIVLFLAFKLPALKINTNTKLMMIPEITPNEKDSASSSITNKIFIVVLFFLKNKKFQMLKKAMGTSNKE